MLKNIVIQNYNIQLRDTYVLLVTVSVTFEKKRDFRERTIFKAFYF